MVGSCVDDISVILALPSPSFPIILDIPLGDGIYYYQFAQPVYLSNKPSEANAPYWRVNVVPINN